MPVELVGLLSPDSYNYLMGLAGLSSALVVLIIWSRGL